MSQRGRDNLQLQIYIKTKKFQEKEEGTSLPLFLTGELGL